MSNVFSAKRDSVVSSYQFLDGSVTPITVYSLSSKEQADLNKTSTADFDAAISNVEASIRLRLKDTDPVILEKIITEQYENADVVDFVRALGQIIADAKAGK